MFLFLSKSCTTSLPLDTLSCVRQSTTVVCLSAVGCVGPVQSEEDCDENYCWHSSICWKSGRLAYWKCAQVINTKIVEQDCRLRSKMISTISKVPPICFPFIQDKRRTVIGRTDVIFSTLSSLHSVAIRLLIQDSDAEGSS